MSLSVPSLLLAVCLVLRVSADGGQAQYGVPDTGYDSSYSQPSAPTGYSAPSASYDYGFEQGGYAATQEDGLDLGKLTDLIPIFVVVFAAIILAQLIAPLFAQLFALLLAIIGHPLLLQLSLLLLLLPAQEGP